MRKIPCEIDNPIDNLLLNFIDKLCPIFKKANFTPNGITTISLFFGLISMYFLYAGKIYFFGLSYFISYFFDCMDGYYARKYNMVSLIGDIYDHIKDAVIAIGIFIIFLKRNYSCSKQNILFAFILFTACMIPMLVHMGCTEKISKRDESPSLNFTKILCPNVKAVSYFKYFGCATMILVFIFTIIWTEMKNKECIRK